MRTVIEMLPELIGPDAKPFDLRFIGPDGREVDTAALVLVSNDPYSIDPPARRRNRRDIDGGVLGVIAVSGPPPHGLTEWSTPTFRVDSGTIIALGIDGESVAVEPPLVFASDPLALRVLLPVHRPRQRLASLRRPRPSKRHAPPRREQP